MSSYPKEADYRFDPNEFRKATERGVVTLGMIYSYFNHKDIWTEFHPQYWTAKSVAFSIGRLLRFYWQAKVGYRGKSKDLAELAKSGPKGPAIIIGSGPTLDLALPHLKDWKGAIFCNSSQASTLVYHGRHPDFIDVADPRVTVEELQAPFDFKKTAAIINPEVHPRFIDFWRGQKYYYRTYEPTYDFYGKVLPQVYGEYIRTFSYPFGSQPPMAVTHAQAVGYNPLFLVGVDFGFPGGIGRFTAWRKPERKWICSPPGTIDQDRGCDQWIMEADNGVLSAPIHIFYRDQLMRVIALDIPQIFCCPVKGIFGIITPDQIPHIAFEDVMACQGQGLEKYYRSPEKIRVDSLRFLAKKCVYLLPCKSGHKFVGMSDWRNDLRDMVNIFNQQDAGIKYEEAYKYLEELTEGIDSKGEAEKPIIDQEKIWPGAGLSDENETES